MWSFWVEGRASSHHFHRCPSPAPPTSQQNMTLDTCRWSPETAATEKAQPPGRSCSGFWRVTDRDLSTPMDMHECAHTHRHTQIDTHTHTYMSMHSHTHRHTYTYTYVNTHTYMSIYTHIHSTPASGTMLPASLLPRILSADSLLPADLAVNQVDCLTVFCLLFHGCHHLVTSPLGRGSRSTGKKKKNEARNSLRKEVDRQTAHHSVPTLSEPAYSLSTVDKTKAGVTFLIHNKHEIISRT